MHFFFYSEDGHTFLLLGQIQVPLVDVHAKDLDDGIDNVDTDLGGGHDTEQPKVGGEQVVDIGLVNVLENQVKTKEGHRSKEWEHVRVLE